MIRVHVRNDAQLFTKDLDESPIEFGRNEQTLNQDDSAFKVVVEDKYASRHHARLERNGPNGLLLKNLSSTQPILTTDGTEIPPGQSLEHAEKTIYFWIGKTWIEVEIDAEPQEIFATILSAAESGEIDSVLKKFNEIETPTLELLTQWFETLVSVQRAAAGATDFYQQAAEAAVRLIGFERALVLSRENNDWEVCGQSSSVDSDSAKFSQSLLQRVVREQRTFYQSSEQLQSISDGGLAAASPIFDATGENVIGALYGYRLISGGSEHSCEITPIDAQLLQMLASVVSLGIVRTKREEEAQVLKVQFEQFFSPALARELDKDPSLLEGRERQVTVLFGDLRNFTTHASKLSPSETCNAITDVLECMTKAVRRNQGVVVDYAGDGIMAIWNAPSDQPMHADLAATSALETLRDLPEVSKKWEARIGASFRVGIGINTGEALVGNTGTSYKFKYGPLGHCVNLASRVESATKHIGVPILITQSTRDLLSDKFQTRRLLKIRVVGVDEPVPVYELHGDDPSGTWNTQRDLYERALAQFEDKEWAKSCQTIQPLLFKRDEDIGDLPSLMLAGRAIECLKSPPRVFEAVVDLDRK